MTRRNWMVFAAMLIAASALVLAGCGGDDNGLSSEDMARLAAAETAAAAAQETADQATMDAAMAQDEAHEAEEAAAAAQMEAEAADMRAMEAEAAAAAADMRAMEAEAATEELQEQLDMQAEQAAEYSPTDPGGTLEGVEGRAAAQRIEEGVSRRNFGRELIDPALTHGGPANDDTATVETNNDLVFTAHSASGPVDPAGVTAIAKDVSIIGLERSRLGTAAELTLAVKGGTGLSTAMDSAESDAPAITGFTGVSLEKDGPGAVSQMALVYSDAERSVRAFGDVYRYSVNRMGVSAVVETSRTHLAVISDLMDLDTDADGVQGQKLAAIDPKISITHGLSTTTGVTTRTVSAGDGVAGSYDGVAGQYVCVVACTIALDSDGDVTIGDLVDAETPTVVPDLVFRANNAEALLPDTDYLAFGVWTEVPDSPTLGNPGRTRAFVGASAAVFKYEDLGDLAGQASYSGGATGHYATRAQGSHTAEMGRFTASAALTADFDGGPAGLLSGKITGFMDEDGTEMAGWVVNLMNGNMITERFEDEITGSDRTATPMMPDMLADPSDATAMTDPYVNDGARLSNAFKDNDVLIARPSTDGDIYGGTTGTTGSQAWSGNWDAWMFGNNLDAHPTGVAGRFIATAGSAQPQITAEGRINLFTDEGFAGVVGSFAGR